ncbi:MAG: Wzz/FepE/Etk N-terminal domain-containing protein, partial [Candidatus Wallbacteria bacterium]|nr:Wzz/FepE/Etk N-terminal domain-containing protein [Candidatus Wallbacteria bacterium]
MADNRRDCESGIDIRFVTDILKESTVLIFAITALFTIIGLFYGLLGEKTYQSGAKLLVLQSTEGADKYAKHAQSDSLKALISSRPVMEGAAAAMIEQWKENGWILRPSIEHKIKQVFGWPV